VIKELKIDELSGLEPMALSFFTEAKLPGVFNMPHFLKNWQYFYDNKMGVVIGLFDDMTGDACGAIGCICTPDLITGEPVSSEAFWYVREGCRGGGVKLLRAFEEWSKANGCICVRMMYLPGLMSDDIRDLYIRLGYREVEVAYEKRVS